MSVAFERGEAPLAVIFRRLSHAARTGGSLEGLKIALDEEVKTEYDNRALPCLNVLSWEEEEESTNIMVKTEGRVTFALNILPQSRFIDYMKIKDTKSAMHYINRIKETIEKDYDGELDLLLEGYSQHEIRFNSTESDLSAEAKHHVFEIEVTYWPKVIPRGCWSEEVPLKTFKTDRAAEAIPFDPKARVCPYGCKHSPCEHTCK